MGGGKGGSSDASGMYSALASAQAADQAYALGEQQLQWTQQVWNQEQPMIQAVTSADVAAQQQQTAFAAQQQQLYTQTYQPLEQQYVQQAQQWASPQQQQLNAAAAESNVNEAAESQRQASTEQLESYGINPGSTRFAGLDIGSRTQQAAAAAGAGTTASQATLLQGLGLEAGAINTGRGVANTTSTLTTSGVGAGSAAAGASQSNLATGSSAQTAASNWYNTGAANMNTYVNAVNGYNQSQLGYAQVGAMQSMGLGSLAGGVLGLLELGGPVTHMEKGGRVTLGVHPLTQHFINYVGNGDQDLARHFLHKTYPDGPPANNRVWAQLFSDLGADRLTRTAQGYQDGGDVLTGAAIPPQYQAMPASRNIEDRRMGPNLPPQPWRGYPVGQEFVSPEGRRYAAANMPARAPTGPIAEAGPIEGIPQNSAWYQTHPLPTRPATATASNYQEGGDIPYDVGQTAPSGNGGNVTQSPGATSSFAIPPGGTPGGGVPADASPSGGSATDDVPARLTAGEFVVPKDVATWKGHEYFVKEIDKARMAQQNFKQRGDIGGERGTAIPAQPTFVSRPVSEGMRTGSPGVAVAAGAIPPRPQAPQPQP